MFSNKSNQDDKDYMAEPIRSQKQSTTGWQMALFAIGGIWALAAQSGDEPSGPCLPENQGCVSGFELPEELPFN